MSMRGISGSLAQQRLLLCGISSCEFAWGPANRRTVPDSGVIRNPYDLGAQTASLMPTYRDRLTAVERPFSKCMKLQMRDLRKCSDHKAE